MKKQQAIITAALLGFALAACHKSQTPANGGGSQAPAANSEAQMRATYGFAAQLPANTESYVGVYQLGKLWNDLKQSKTWAAVKANPMIAKELNDPSFREAKNRAETNDEAAKWKGIVKEAFGNESFIALAQGSAAKLHVWMDAANAMRMANFENVIATGGKKQQDPGAMFRALLPYAKDLDLPPMLIGFKITSQKATLDAELAHATASLPPFVESGTFTVGSLPFKSLAVTVSKALQPQQQAMVQNMVAMNISDPQQAASITQALLAHRIEIAYGYVGDYFVVSIGPDHSQLKFAASYADSILALPEVQAAGNYTGKPVLMFSWSTAEAQAACQQEFHLMALYEKLKQEIDQAVPPADQQKLLEDLKRLDEEENGFFKHDFVPLVAVTYRDQGLRSEVFGGMKNNGPTEGVKFSGVPSASTFVWVDQVANQAVNDAFRIWFEDLCATSYDTFQRVGLPLVPPEQRMGFAMVQSLAVPKLVEFYKISRDQFAKSLGLENAFAMDLNGEVPDMPMLVPPQLHTGGKILRMAYLSDVRDRALLGESWKSYFKLAGDIVQMTPAAATFPAGLPSPANEVVEGVTLSYYPLPMPTGDLLPNIAVTDKTFVISTSRSYSLELTKAAAQAAPASKPVSLDFRVNFQPAFDFANAWLALAAQNPELFFKGNEKEASDFKNMEPDLASLLQTLRVFDGMSMQMSEENGVPRISSEIRWNEH
jgi:hypothetical protein